ncbi:MAG: ROK family protein [bacterium]
MLKENAIGIDIGGTNLRIALVARDGKILERAQHPSRDSILETIASGIDAFRDKDTAGIGIASAGLIDRKQGTVLVSPNLPGVEGIRFRALLEEKYHIPVFIENDANLAALGEKFVGAGKDFTSFILMTLGTGIGGGIVHNNRLLDIPAEIGHMVVEPGGLKCSCGNTGCLEEYAAAKALVSSALTLLEKGQESTLRSCCEGSIYRITPQHIHEHALDGDSLSREVLRSAGRYLGIGISNLTNIFNPEAFILTGGLAHAWDFYIEEALREAEKRAMKGLFRKDSVLRSAISEDAGLIGAALYALHAVAGYPES